MYSSLVASQDRKLGSVKKEAGKEFNKPLSKSGCLNLVPERTGSFARFSDSCCGEQGDNGDGLSRRQFSKERGFVIR